MRRTGKVIFAAAVIFLVILFLVPGLPNKRIPTEEEVTRVVAIGVSEETVRNAFGKPLAVDEDRHGVRVATYHFSPRGKAYTHRFSGFQVSYQSNRVISWNPIHSNRE